MPDHAVVKLVVIALWLTTIYLHELAHALTAYWGGDREIRERGGFSPIMIWFNNPMMGLVLPAIVLLFAGFAMPGAATKINRSALRSRGVISLVFLAGPAMTLVMAGVLAGVYQLATAPLVRDALAFTVFLTIMSFLLNLLPLPSLDGFGAIGAHLPPRVEHWAYRAAIPTVIFIALLLMAVPKAAGVVADVCIRGTELLGVDAQDLKSGFTLFRVGLGRKA
jgi:Zn-dependent protease